MTNQTTLPPMPALPAPTPTKKKSLVRRSLPYVATAIVALGLGAAMGGAGAAGGETAEPAPAKTVTVEKTVETGVPAECKDAAEDLFAMLQDYNQNVGLPLIDAVQNAAYGDLSSATSTLSDVTDLISGYTDRVNTVISPEYVACGGK